MLAKSLPSVSGHITGGKNPRKRTHAKKATLIPPSPLSPNTPLVILPQTDFSLMKKLDHCFAVMFRVEYNSNVEVTIFYIK